MTIEFVFVLHRQGVSFNLFFPHSCYIFFIQWRHEMGLIILFKKQFICMVDIFIIVVMLFSLFIGFCGLKVGS